MKIAICYPLPPPIKNQIPKLPGGLVTGGGETYPLSLAKALARNGHQVDYFTGKMSGITVDQLTPQVGLTVHYLPLRNKHSVMGAWTFRLFPLLIRGRYTLINAIQLPTLFTFMAGLASKVTHSKFVVSHHGFDPRFNKKSLLLAKCNAVLLNYLTVQSPHAASFYSGVVDSKKLIIVPNGIDLQRFHRVKVPEETRKQYQDKLVLGYIGRLLPSKGIDVLIKAAYRLKMRGYQVKILIGGKGPFLSYLRDLAKEKNLEKEIEFLGFIPENKLNLYYSLFDIFVLSSVQKDILGGFTPESEAFGLVLGEAMACETPVIASRVGGVPAWIKDNENGLLFTPGDDAELAQGIVRLATDKKFASEMAQRAKKILQEQYSIDKIAEQFELLAG